MAKLMDYRTGDTLRDATSAEEQASRAASVRDGGTGVITVGGVSCYVDGAAVDHCEMCNAIREHVPARGEDVVLLVDDADVQPVDAVRAPDGWIAWDIGGGWAFACASCAATLTIRAPVRPDAETRTYVPRGGAYLVTFSNGVTVNVHNGASGQRGPTWYAMKPSDQRISGEECSAYQRAALTLVLGAMGVSHTLRVDRIGDIIATVQS